jgi:hypothetical protein
VPFAARGGLERRRLRMDGPAQSRQYLAGSWW